MNTVAESKPSVKKEEEKKIQQQKEEEKKVNPPKKEEEKKDSSPANLATGTNSNVVPIPAIANPQQKLASPAAKIITKPVMRPATKPPAKKQPPKRVVPPDILKLMAIYNESTDNGDWSQVVNETNITFHKRAVLTHTNIWLD